MSIEKLINRWFVVVGTILIQLAFGPIYAWSAFTKVLSGPAGANQLTLAQTARILSAALFFVELVVIFLSLRW